MNKKSGSFSAIFRTSSSIWPFKNETVIGSGGMNGITCTLFGHSDGSISFSVHEGGKVHIDYHAQAVLFEFSDICHVLVVVSWGSVSGTFVSVAGSKLKDFKENKDPYTIPRSKGDAPEMNHILEQCALWKPTDWILKRKTYFSDTKFAPRSGERAKTVHEQVADLVRARNSLLILTQIQTKGYSDLFGAIAAILRALTYWDNRGPNRNYDSLLFRLASFGDVELPVYSRWYPTEAIEHIAAASKGQFFIYVSPVLEPKENLTSRMDFQEWLLMTSVSIAIDPRKGSFSSFSSKDVIASIANKLGVSHYDRSISPTAEMIFSVVDSEGPLMTKFLHELTICTIGLSEKVLEHYGITTPESATPKYDPNRIGEGI